MSDKVKDINIKIRIYYFFNYTINTENSDLNNIKIDEKPNKNYLICYIGYVTIKEYAKSYGLNSLYLTFRYVDGYFKVINGSKYLTQYCCFKH